MKCTVQQSLSRTKEAGLELRLDCCANTPFRVKESNERSGLNGVPSSSHRGPAHRLEKLRVTGITMVYKISLMTVVY